MNCWFGSVSYIMIGLVSLDFCGVLSIILVLRCWLYVGVFGFWVDIHLLWILDYPLVNYSVDLQGSYWTFIHVFVCWFFWLLIIFMLLHTLSYVGWHFFHLDRQSFIDDYFQFCWLLNLIIRSWLDIDLAVGYHVGSLRHIICCFDVLSCLVDNHLWMINLDGHLFGSLVENDWRY